MRLVESLHPEGDGIVRVAHFDCFSGASGDMILGALIDAGVDIVNFDAFNYGDTIAMYPQAVKAHLERGGMLAWGVVPTSVAIREQTVETLEAQLEKVMDGLAATGIPKALITEQAIITPSCGTGSMDPADAERVFQMTHDLSKRMKEKYSY